MNKYFKSFILFSTMTFLFLMSGFTYAMSTENSFEPKAVSRISVAADRTSSTNVDIRVTGSASSKANSIAMTATLYEYSSGKLTKADVSQVTQTIKNSMTFDFDFNFKLKSDKTYKVKIVVKDVTNGVTTSTEKTSNSF